MKRIAIMLALIGSTSSAFAADLLEFYNEARTNDSQFAAAKAQQIAGREKLPQARAGLLPNVALTAGTQYNYSSLAIPYTWDFQYNSNNYQVQLTQPIFRWQNWVGYEQGTLQVGVTEAQYAAAESDLILRVAQAYFDVLYAEDVLSSIQALKKASEQQLQLAKKSFEVGTVTVTDVYEAQSRYDLNNAQEIAAQNDLDVKREALRLLTGKAPQALAKLRPNVHITPPEPTNMEKWVAEAEQSNPNVQAQFLSREIARYEIDKRRSGHLPTVDLVASYGRTHAGNNGSTGQPYKQSNGVVGLQLTIPIFEGGGTQSRVREAVALSDKAKADLDTARRTASQSARQAYLGVTSGIAQVLGYEAAIRSSQSSVDANKLGYEVGVRINIDVLNAQSQLADTQQKLAKSRYDTLVSQLKLKSAAGSLSVDDVAQVNDFLIH